MSPNPFTGFWWGTRDADNAAKLMIATAEHLRTEHSGRLEKIARLTQAYRAKDTTGFKPTQWMSKISDAIGVPLTYNVTKSCIDTVCARLGLHDPSPMFSTFGADYERRARAQGMQKLAEGILQIEDAPRVHLKAQRDACIGDAGFVKVLPDNDAIRIRRRHPARIFWDFAATLDDQPPPTIYEVDYLTRAELWTRFPQHWARLQEVAPLDFPESGRATRELCEVWEGHHPARGKAPGRHLVAVQGIPLLWEEWTDPIPYRSIVWGLGDVMGWTGISLAEELEGIQQEIDFTLEKLRSNLESIAETVWMRHKASQVNLEELATNEPHRVVDYVGQAPQAYTPPAAHPQVFEWVETLYRRAFELCGVSEFSATSRKPADLESGAAIRAYQEPETIRFSPQAKAFANLTVGISQEIIRCGRRLARSKPGWSTRYVGRDGTLEQVKWSQVSLEEDQFVIRPQPMSAMPLQPSSRLERAAELARDQLIDRATFLQLANVPDLEQWNKLATSPYENHCRVFEKMLASGDYIKPLEYDPDLDLGMAICKGYWARSQCEELPQDRINLLEIWLRDAAKLKTLQSMPPPVAGAPVVGAAPAQVAAPPGLGGMPLTGGPGAPPQPPGPGPAPMMG